MDDPGAGELQGSPGCLTVERQDVGMSRRLVARTGAWARWQEDVTAARGRCHRGGGKSKRRRPQARL